MSWFLQQQSTPQAFHAAERQIAHKVSPTHWRRGHSTHFNPHALCRYPLVMEEEANFTAQYVAQLDTVTLLPDLAYSNAATLSFCDAVRFGGPHALTLGDCLQRRISAQPLISA